MIFRIEGVDRKSNEARNITIQARDEAAAALMAIQVGIMVSSIHPVAEETAPDAVAQPAAEVSPHTLPPRPSTSRQNYSTVADRNPTVTSAKPSLLWIVYALIGLIALGFFISGWWDFYWKPEVTNAYYSDTTYTEPSVHSPDATVVATDPTQAPTEAEPAPTVTPAAPSVVPAQVINYAELSTMTTALSTEKTAHAQLGMMKWLAAVLLVILIEVIRTRDLLDRRLEVE